MESKKTPHYIGHRQRLKDRFAKEPKSLADYELLELILGYAIPRKDLKPLAKELLSRAKSLTELLFHDISEVDGVGKHTEILLMAIKEYCDRCNKEIIKIKSKKLATAIAVYNFLKYTIALGQKESFVAIYLNSRQYLIEYEIMNTGTVNSAPVYPREVTEKALKVGACYVVIAHNHPSGENEPSTDDIVITKQVKKALTTVEIKLLDHVIVSKTGYYSLRKNKLI